MKKFQNKPNVVGRLLKEHRENMGLSKEEVSSKLQLYGIDINRVELYRMETNQMIIKDFELIALCKILNIKIDEFNNILDL